MGALNGNGERALSWLRGESVALLARACSILGTAIAAIAVWIFLGLWNDVRELRSTLTASITQLSVVTATHEVRIGAQDTRMADTNARVQRLEQKVFP